MFRNEDEIKRIVTGSRFMNTWMHDSLFLFGAVFVSALPYLTGLGFYSDDWYYIPALVQVSPQRFVPLLRALIMSDGDLRVRPVQAVYLTLSYKAFGLHPLLWHITDQVILGFAIITLYLAMREVLHNRTLALTVALVFGVLPHYSTDRLWATMAAGLSALFAYLGIFALAKLVDAKNGQPLLWLLFAGATMALSALSYEVELGLIAASILVAGWRAYRQVRTSADSSKGRLLGIMGLGAVSLAVVAAKIHFQTRITYHNHFFGRFWKLIGHGASQAVQFNLWTYGIHMPFVLVALFRDSAISAASICIALLLATLTAVYLWRVHSPNSVPSPATCLRLLFAGFLIFALGYGLFLSAPDVDFTSMGFSNRMAIASALGAACVLVSMAGFVCALIGRSLQKSAYVVLIATACGLNYVVMSGIGHFWVDAAKRQREAVQSLTDNVHTLPHGAVLLLDGVCRFTGPAVVFLSEDAAGPIQIAFGDFSLNSNVVAPNMRFGPAAVETTMFGQLATSYPYSQNLFVYNVPHRQLTHLPSESEAKAYLDLVDPSENSDCSSTHEGLEDNTE